MIWLQERLDEIGISQEEAYFRVTDSIIKERLTGVGATALVIQAMLRGGDRDWVLAQGAPAGSRNKAIDARISDARRILAEHGLPGATLPSSPETRERLRRMLGPLVSTPPRV